MKKLLNILFIIIYTNVIFAQTSEGGGAFIQNNGKLINCVISKNYAINGFGVSGDLSGGNVINCTIVGNFYLNKAIIYPGDVVLIDGSVYSAQYNADGSIKTIPDAVKTNVQGVCFWSNGNNDFLNAKAWIIAVNELTGTIIWTPTVVYQNEDIPNLINYSNATGAIADKDGEGNTLKIISDTRFVGNSEGGTFALTTTNCAAKYCFQYSSISGEWYLPSLSQLQELYRSFITVNKVLNALGKTPISPLQYWSSTEGTNWGAWCYDFSKNGVFDANQIDKKTNIKVRAMKSFKQNN